MPLILPSPPHYVFPYHGIPAFLFYNQTFPRIQHSNPGHFPRIQHSNSRPFYSHTTFKFQAIPDHFPRTNSRPFYSHSTFKFQAIFLAFNIQIPGHLCIQHSNSRPFYSHSTFKFQAIFLAFNIQIPGHLRIQHSNCRPFAHPTFKFQAILSHSTFKFQAICASNIQIPGHSLAFNIQIPGHLRIQYSNPRPFPSHPTFKF
ncbi:hypothetical protein niasHT_033536 [Heterodera trifolii]|uniref:Uncharacterized protein n=1 Tax=Heterodera trifolii TaxID=157864 RepID=A0ABD2J764_9BILA